MDAAPTQPRRSHGNVANAAGSPFIARPRQVWLTPTAPHHVTDVSHFLDCLEQGRESSVSVELAAQATEVLMAGYRSAATQQTVTLPLDSSN